MISIEHSQVAGIPLLEIAPHDKFYTPCPTVFFYHGWGQSKDKDLLTGIELAKCGLRTIIPDAYLHGERKETNTHPHAFWEVLQHNIAEFPKLLSAYHDRILDGKIGIAGISMGGFTSYALLTHFPQIQAAAVLMGNPDMQRFADYIPHSPWAAAGSIDEGAYQKSLRPYQDFFADYSISRHPETLAHRPLYLWHGCADQAVPYHFNLDFYQTIKNQPYADQTIWEETPDRGHDVPYEIKCRTAQFLAQHLT